MYWLLTAILVLVFLAAVDLAIGPESVSKGFGTAWRWFTAPTYRTVSETEIIIPAHGTTRERIEKAQNFLRDNGKLDRLVSMVLVNPDSVRIVLTPAGHPR
jgi:hypothetical protein